jgi:prevent-host-death family protein
MTRLTASAVREEFSEILNRVAYKGERIVLERRGKDVAALVPVEDLELLERLEDHMDLEAARKALEEQGSVSLDELKTELGI